MMMMLVIVVVLMMMQVHRRVNNNDLRLDDLSEDAQRSVILNERCTA